jgi:hypothetical protein
MRMRLLGRAAASLLATAALALGFVNLAQAGDSAAPADTETVKILDAAKSGDLAVTVRGAGESKVKFSIKNKSAKRLNVVIPPGLVASAATGQALQSMGLGTPTSNLGSFGAFQGNNRNASGSFRSIPASAPVAEGIAVSPGQTIEVFVPSVCLNFGLPTPMPKNVFRLVDVETYSSDVRVRRALKSLSTLGTSQTVAQAVMWNVCNGMTFEQIGFQKVVPFNTHEIAQAARFVEAVDTSSTDVVEASYFQQGRIALRVQGEGLTAKDAKRLAAELDGVSLMGLPIRVVTDLNDVQPRPGTILISASIVGSKPSLTSIRGNVRAASLDGQWVSLGQFDAKSASAASDLKADEFSAELGRGIAKAFVSVSVVRRATGSTVVKITNRLPMTIANLSLKAGKAGDVVAVDAIGVGTGRSATTTVSAATASIDSVELNGL